MNRVIDSDDGRVEPTQLRNKTAYHACQACMVALHGMHHTALSRHSHAALQASLWRIKTLTFACELCTLSLVQFLCGPCLCAAPSSSSPSLSPSAARPFASSPCRFPFLQQLSGSLRRPGLVASTLLVLSQPSNRESTSLPVWNVGSPRPALQRNQPSSLLLIAELPAPHFQDRSAQYEAVSLSEYVGVQRGGCMEHVHMRCGSLGRDMEEAGQQRL